MVEKHGLLHQFSGQGVEKLNDKIKTIHQKSSNKLDQTRDELLVRKRIKFLTESNCEREKRKYVKQNAEYWDNDIRERHSAKRQKIETEMTVAHSRYVERLRQCETPLHEMSVHE